MYQFNKNNFNLSLSFWTILRIINLACIDVNHYPNFEAYIKCIHTYKGAYTQYLHTIYNTVNKIVQHKLYNYLHIQTYIYTILYTYI